MLCICLCITVDQGDGGYNRDILNSILNFFSGVKQPVFVDFIDDKFKKKLMVCITSGKKKFIKCSNFCLYLPQSVFTPF